MKFKIIENYLIEGIADARKFYPTISDDDFNRIIRLDPTTNIERDKLGSYSKWLLNLFKKGNLDNEGHVTDLLNRFESEKNHLINKDIMKYKSLEEVDNVLNDENSYKNLTNRQKLRQTQNVVKKTNVEDDAKKVFEDDKWVVWIPVTYEASCKLGQGTHWCTATTSSNHYFYHYAKDGNLYININKQNPDDKYQFHFESESFMDKDDHRIDLTAFLSKDKKLRDFYVNHVDSLSLNSFINILGESAFDMEYRERLQVLSKNINDETDVVMIYSKLGNALFDETKFGFILQDFIDYVCESDNHFSSNGYQLYQLIEKYNGGDTPFYELAASIGTPFCKTSYKDYLVNKLCDLFHNDGGKDVIHVSTEELAKYLESRDISKEFLVKIMDGDIYEYWDNYDEYNENAWSDALIYIDKNNTEILAKLGVEPTEESIENSPKGYDIKDAINLACSDGENDGAINEALTSFRNAFDESLPNHVKAYLPHEYEEDSDDIICVLKSCEEYINDNYMCILLSADDYDGMTGSVESSIERSIEEDFKWYEPQYGWYGFSEDAFNDSLSWRLSEIGE